MTSEELKIEFKSGKYDFYGKIISDEIEIFNSDLSRLEWLRFDNCHFEKIELYEIINIRNLIFHNCTFNNEVNLTRCKIDDLQFSYINDIKRLSILYGKFNNIRINSGKSTLNCDIEIDDTSIFEILDCSNLIIKEGQFSLSTRYKIEESKNNFRLNLKNSKIDLLNLSSCNFKNTSDFKNLEIFKTSFFINCVFKKVSFQGSNMGDYGFFKDCLFESNTNFEDCDYKDTNSTINFSNCTFKDYSSFNNSKFNKLEILHSTFLDKISFDNLETNSFKINQVTFAKSAYFDDLNKKNNKAIENWDRKTIRAIKRELVNAHNQIDYLRFKAYELKAYKKEKDKNWKDNLILFFNEKSNNYGLDWTKGICFILKTSFIFYLFYLITFIISIKDSNCLPQNCEEFLVSYIKFLNPLSFLKTPNEEAEEYIFPLLFLNISKIFVSYGIYQTIQAFRKFGVNGG